MVKHFDKQFKVDAVHTIMIIANWGGLAVHETQVLANSHYPDGRKSCVNLTVQSVAVLETG